MPSETPVLDNFNRANGAVGSNWTTVSGASTPTIISNQVASPSLRARAYWNLSTFTSPLEIYVTVNVFERNVELYYCMTNPGTDATMSGYFLEGFTGVGAMLLYRVDPGTVITNLGGFLGDPVPGDTFRVRLVNGVHTLYKNDVEQTQINESTYTAGYFRLDIGDTLARCDDFGGGPLSEMTHVLMPPRIYG
jgi:hypothetical protein